MAQWAKDPASVTAVTLVAAVTGVQSLVQEFLHGGEGMAKKKKMTQKYFLDLYFKNSFGVPVVVQCVKNPAQCP